MQLTVPDTSARLRPKFMCTARAMGTVVSASENIKSEDRICAGRLRERAIAGLIVVDGKTLEDPSLFYADQPGILLAMKEDEMVHAA